MKKDNIVESFEFKEVEKCNLEQLDIKLGWLQLYCWENDWKFKESVIEAVRKAIKEKDYEKFVSYMYCADEFTDFEMRNLSTCMHRAHRIMLDEDNSGKVISFPKYERGNE